MISRRSGPGWVVKLGGSLDNEKTLAALLPVIEKLSEKHKLVIVPGGGGFADYIRGRSATRGVPGHVAHAQAVLAMSQFGHDLAARLVRGVVAHDRTNTTKALRAGRIPVFIPYPRVLADTGVPATWDATSDTIAARVCAYMGYKRIVLLKSVDGVVLGQKLADRIGRARLARCDVVDPTLEKFLAKGWGCFIINGRRPERLAQLVRTGNTTMTRIDT